MGRCWRRSQDFPWWGHWSVSYAPVQGSIPGLCGCRWLKSVGHKQAESGREIYGEIEGLTGEKGMRGWGDKAIRRHCIHTCKKWSKIMFNKNAKNSKLKNTQNMMFHTKRKSKINNL